MNTAFYIARRYFFSKRFRNAVNIISGISITGVAVGSMALVIVLSVFNGFEALILSLVNAFNSDLKVTVREGKVFHMDDVPVEEIQNIPGIVHFSQVVEDDALFRYEDRQHVGVIKGVDSAYLKMTPVDTMLLEGSFRLQEGEISYGVIGQGVAYFLGLRLSGERIPVNIFVPRRDARPGSHAPMAAFNQKNIYPSGVFGVQPEIDESYILLPLETARELYDYTDEVSALEIGLGPEANIKQTARQLQQTLGNEFNVQTRIQQQQILHKILQSEKWMTFLILSLILIIATFNVIGSLSLVILDKRKDTGILFSMGATPGLIRRIFLYEGMLITFAGAIAGIVLGLGIALLQQEFGLISMGSAGSFMIDAYPVKVQISDLIAIFVLVMLIGYLTALFPVRQISKKFMAVERKK
ncbi:MAG: FtsX-like permease family protein [Bacteroidales bacterium]